MFLQCACVCQTIYGEQALTFSQTERLENQQSAEKGQLKTDPNGTLTHTHTHKLSQSYHTDSGHRKVNWARIVSCEQADGYTVGVEDACVK